MNVLNLIGRMTADELNEVTDAIRLRRTYLGKEAARSLRIGDNVTFDANTRGRQTGPVVKINVKTLQVRSNGVVWKVPMSLVTKV